MARRGRCLRIETKGTACAQENIDPMPEPIVAEDAEPPSRLCPDGKRSSVSTFRTTKETPAAQPPFFASAAKRPPARERFPGNPGSQLFRKTFFPDTIRRRQGSLPVGITPFYLALLDPYDPTQPLRGTHVPVGAEYPRGLGKADDPLGQDHDAVVPGLVHRYPDRVLFLTTGTCSTCCRYCTCSRTVGAVGGEYSFSLPQGERVIDAGGRIPLHPDYVVGRDGGDLLLTSFENGLCRYPNPDGRPGAGTTTAEVRGDDQ